MFTNIVNKSRRQMNLFVVQQVVDSGILDWSLLHNTYGMT